MATASDKYELRPLQVPPDNSADLANLYNAEAVRTPQPPGVVNAGFDPKSEETSIDVAPTSPRPGTSRVDGRFIL